jgi:tetratricopeptide (TPR) repeat protein
MNRNLLDEAVDLHRQGNLDQAEQLYRRVLADASHMLGVLKAQQGQNKIALDLIAPVAAAYPRNVLALENLANVLRALQRYDEALNYFDAALALEPSNATAWLNRANTLVDMGKPMEAVADYDRALSLQPNLTLALNNRGSALLKMEEYEAAVDSFKRALALNPNLSATHVNLGDALQRLCRYEEALTNYDRALALDPGNPSGWCNRGVVLEQLSNLDAARQNFIHAEKLLPGMPEARLNRARLCLLQQDFTNGWPLFEARKQMPEPWDARDFTQPLWTGVESIEGKILFTYIQCGLGDAIQFYRYVAKVQAKGARVILSVNDALLPVLQRANPVVSMIGIGQVPKQFDYHIPLMSMPLALQINIPETGRYIAADPNRVAQWQQRLGDEGFRVAVVWQSNVGKGAEGKSFSVSVLAGIAAIPGIRLISLQKNEGTHQLRHLPPGMIVEHFEDLDNGIGAFQDSAAILENCELLISCDTGLAHLAGALGIPNWIALKHVPDWRWFLGRSDTPWYPKTRLFRQAAPGKWDSVFSAMENELMALVR